MALQGTLDTFALPDVLRLLASTTKTGRLRVSGSRGTGSLWIDNGAVVASEASNVPLGSDAVDVVFEMLRYVEGSFTFDVDAVIADPSAPDDVEPLLYEAETLLAEWREIEAVVPSLDSWVSLAPELPAPEVNIDADVWKAIVTVGSGTTVGAMGEVLGLPEVPVSRLVKDLVELQLAEVTAGRYANEPVVTWSDPGGYDTTLGTPTEAFAMEPMMVGEAQADELTNGGPVTQAADRPVLSVVPEPELVAPTWGPEPSGLSEADEVARQLATLSPRAAQAVAAAAHATTDEEREAAIAQVAAQVAEEDEPLNRGLLLKFLGSVRN